MQGMSSGDSLNAPYAGSNTTFGGNLQTTNVARACHMGATAQFF